MQLPFLSRSKSLDPKLLPPSSPWTFPSGGHVKTLFFRGEDDTAFRTFNSAFLDNNSSCSRSFSTMSDEYIGEPVEAVIQGLRSDRFFFEPEQSSSLVKYIENKGCSSGKELEAEENRGSIVSGYKESEMLWVDSSNPYEDFKRSMEDMVVAYGLMRDWDGLEELLSCYLKINGKNNHGYILGAFIDLLVSFSSSSSSPSSLPSTSSTTTTTTLMSSSIPSSNSIVYSSPSSPLSLPSSSLPTPSLSSALDHDGDDVNYDGDDDDHVSS